MPFLIGETRGFALAKRSSRSVQIVSQIRISFIVHFVICCFLLEPSSQHPNPEGRASHTVFYATHSGHYSILI